MAQFSFGRERGGSGPRAKGILRYYAQGYGIEAPGPWR